MEVISDTTLLASPNQLKASGILDQNIDENIIAANIRIVQLTIIRDIIGDRLYERLQELIEQDLICDDEYECYKRLLDGYIHEIIAWNVKGKLAYDLTFSLRNGGVIQRTDGNLQTVPWSTAANISDEWKNNADALVRGMHRYLKCNFKCFPELRECGCFWEKRPHEHSGINSAIFFPNKSCDTYNRFRKKYW